MVVLQRKTIQITVTLPTHSLEAHSRNSQVFQKIVWIDGCIMPPRFDHGDGAMIKSALLIMDRNVLQSFFLVYINELRRAN